MLLALVDDARATSADGSRCRASPSVDHDPCLLQCVKDLAVEQFVVQRAVEGFAVTVFARACWFDVGGLGTDGVDPFLEREGNRAFVRSLGTVVPVPLRRATTSAI